jgi:hypothetical protein
MKFHHGCTWIELLTSCDTGINIGTGVLLDDLLVAEDLAAAETTSAASHAAAAAASVNSEVGRSPTGRYAYADDKARQPGSESVPDGAVVLGTPVAPPVNGDMYTDISPENAVLQGQR